MYANCRHFRLNKEIGVEEHDGDVGFYTGSGNMTVLCMRNASGDNNRNSSFIVDEAMGPVASLGWVTLGAATEGVTPLFFLKNMATFLLILLIAVTITIAFYCFHSGATWGVTPHFLYLSDLVSPLFFVNLPTQIFPSGVTPLKAVEGVTLGSPPPPASL